MFRINLEDELHHLNELKSIMWVGDATSGVVNKQMSRTAQLLREWDNYVPHMKHAQGEQDCDIYGLPGLSGEEFSVKVRMLLETNYIIEVVSNGSHPPGERARVLDRHHKVNMLIHARIDELEARMPDEADTVLMQNPYLWENRPLYVIMEA